MQDNSLEHEEQDDESLRAEICAEVEAADKRFNEIQEEYTRLVRIGKYNDISLW